MWLAKAPHSDTGTSLGAVHAAKVPPANRPNAIPHNKVGVATRISDNAAAHATATTIAKKRQRPMPMK